MGGVPLHRQLTNYQRTTMPFDLTIKVRGLCCFVAEPPQRMHVLMPKTEESNGTGTYGPTVMPHDALLTFLRTYDPKDGGSGYQRHRIVGDLCLPDYARGANPQIDPAIGWIGDVVPGACVWPDLLTPSIQHDVLKARLTLTSGAMELPIKKMCVGHRWHIGQLKPKRLAFCADWQIKGINDTKLDWSIKQFDGTTVDHGTLTPDSNDSIELHVSHVMHGEDPDDESTYIDDPSLQIHFQAYYDLFWPGPANTAGAWYPECDEAGGCYGKVRLKDGGHGAAGASTCALSGGGNK
jgi:hypothetical protein